MSNKGPPVVPEKFQTGGPFVMLCTLGIADGKADRVVELLTKNQKHSRTDAEKGTIAYRFFFNEDKKKIMVYEEYEDVAAYKAHNTSPTGPEFGKAIGTEGLFTSMDAEFFREEVVA